MAKNMAERSLVENGGNYNELMTEQKTMNFFRFI